MYVIAYLFVPHITTIRAMRSVKQQEEMRPRSHSSTMSSGNQGSDSKSHSGSGSRRQSNTLGPSWRTRCDSMPVPNRAMPGSRSGSRSRGNSEGEDGQSKEEHAIASSSSPVRLVLKSLHYHFYFFLMFFSSSFGSSWESGLLTVFVYYTFYFHDVYVFRYISFSNMQYVE